MIFFPVHEFGRRETMSAVSPAQALAVAKRTQVGTLVEC